MPQYIDAFGFIFLRVGGPFFYFGWLGCLCPRKIDLGDFPYLPPLFFWVAFNMLTFFFKPYLAYFCFSDYGVYMIVLVLSAIIMKERLKKRMVSGILLGLVGTGFLILYGKSIVNPEQAGYGNF
jgi:drug/metabolite transporter (DMT)-like permease